MDNYSFGKSYQTLDARYAKVLVTKLVLVVTRILESKLLLTI